MKWMNLHHLKYFLSIAEEGSLSGASKKLLVGQPALSAQLKSFEEWLGVELFYRSGKKLQITPAGEYVLKYARAIKNLEEELILNLQHGDDMLKRELVLGAQESVPKSIMAHAISVIRQVRPIKLKVLEGTGDELFSLLTNGKVDFFIGNFKPMSEGKEMFYLSLGKERVAIWGAKKFEKLKKDFPKSLTGKSFVMSGFQNPVRHDFEKFMLQSGFEFEVGVEAQDTALQKELAARGEGLVLLGDESAKAWVSSGRLVRLGYLPNVNEQYWLGMVKRTIDNEYVKSIMNAF
jgi:LysR family transcriptional regulator, transcriptional activator of nhaA